MTQEEKAKAYDEALERARIKYDEYKRLDGKDSYVPSDIEYIFPELKESEAEKIRNVLFGWVSIEPQSSFEGGFSREQILAWIEKQGEKKPEGWKPTTVQMDELLKCTEKRYFDMNALKSLYNDLKKLTV